MRSQGKVSQLLAQTLQSSDSTDTSDSNYASYYDALMNDPSTLFTVLESTGTFFVDSNGEDWFWVSYDGYWSPNADASDWDWTTIGGFYTLSSDDSWQWCSLEGTDNGECSTYILPTIISGDDSTVSATGTE